MHKTSFWAKLCVVSCVIAAVNQFVFNVIFDFEELRGLKLMLVAAPCALINITCVACFFAGLMTILSRGSSRW